MIWPQTCLLTIGTATFIKSWTIEFMISTMLPEHSSKFTTNFQLYGLPRMYGCAMLVAIICIECQQNKLYGSHEFYVCSDIATKTTKMFIVLGNTILWKQSPRSCSSAHQQLYQWHQSGFWRRDCWVTLWWFQGIYDIEAHLCSAVLSISCGSCWTCKTNNTNCNKNSNDNTNHLSRSRTTWSNWCNAYCLENTHPTIDAQIADVISTWCITWLL